MTEHSRQIEHIVDDELQPLDRAVTVVVPAFNEAAHVADQVTSIDRVMRTTGWKYEIIVVDDGSTDGTAEAAIAAGIGRVVRRTPNRGYGAALKLGVRLAAHDWILITDADGTYPVEAIPALLAEAPANSMVVGSRTGETVRVPLVRRPAKWFLNRLASYLAGRRLPDINSGLRLMRKSLINRYEHLLPDGFSFTTTITLAAACNNHPLTYLAIDYHARLGESKIRPRHAYDFTLLIVRTMVFFNPLKVFLPLGAVMAAGAMAKFVYDITKDNLSETAVLGFLGALIVWAVGLLADQNARIATRRK
ncbi:MAG TPA: glycosyltransferase family 2 protein [Gemmatimonadaceae bacterium]